jgi:hypothetical protein
MDNSGALRWGSDGSSPLMRLYQGIHLIPLLGSTALSETQFETRNMTVGKLTFAPVPYLDRKAQFVFNDMYYSYDRSSRVVNSENLFN